MTPSGINGASPGNVGARMSRTIQLRKTLVEILTKGHPMSARGAYYACTVVGAVDKTEAACKKVQRLLVKMREDGTILWGWITDGTGWRRGPNTYAGIDEALYQTPGFIAAPSGITPRSG